MFRPAHLVRLLLAGAIALATSGCWLFKSEAERDAERAAKRAAYKAEMDAKVNVWVGRTTTDLLQQEGPPTVVLDDANGMKIWSYTRETSTVVPGAITLNKAGDNYTASQAEGYIRIHRYSRMFWIDKAGRVTKAAWHER